MMSWHELLQNYVIPHKLINDAKEKLDKAHINEESFESLRCYVASPGKWNTSLNTNYMLVKVN